MPMESVWGNEPLRMAAQGSRSCDWLIAHSGATPEVIGVAIEMTQGPVVEALLERGFCVYGINPKQLDRFRDRFTVAGAKSLPSRKRGTTGATLGCWPTACAPIGRPFAVCQSAPPAPLAGSRGSAHSETEAVVGRTRGGRGGERPSAR